MKKILLFVIAAFVCALGTSAETWKKVTEAQTDWSGKYLIVDEASNLLFKGSMTENTGLTGSSNGAQVVITDGTITTEDASNSFTIAKCGEGWSVQAAGGEYINNTTAVNGMSTSDEPTACTIAFADGYPTITAAGGNKLQSNGSRFRFYASEQKPISLFKLDEGSVISYDVNVNIFNDILYITPSNKTVQYTYFILSETDYLTHFEKGRTTASQIFDAEVKLFDDASKIYTGAQELKISELGLKQDNYYVCAAAIKGTDNGSWIEYSRLAEATDGHFTTIPFVGCKWQKPATAPESWAGQYLLVLEDTEAAFNGSLSTTSSPRIDGFGNYKAIDMEGKEVITDNKEMAFTIEAIEGGYALKNRAGEYLGAYADKNGIQASATPLLIKIAADGTISSEDKQLSLASGKVMFRSTEGENVVLYALTLDAEEQKPDYSQATITLALNEAAKTLTFTPSMEDAPYATVMLTEQEYQAHMEQGRSTNEIFAIETKLLTDDQVRTAPYTLDLSTLAKGHYYFYAATVSGIDYGTFTQYNRLGEASTCDYNTEFTGCKWEKTTGTFDWKGSYMLVAEEAGVAFNGELSGDANTGALCTTNNYTSVSLSNASLKTETKAASFTIESTKGGYTVKSASGYYIGSKTALNGIEASESPITLNINSQGIIRDAACEYTLSYKDGKFSFRNAEALEGAEIVSLYALTIDAEEQEQGDIIPADAHINISIKGQTATLTPSYEMGYAYYTFTAAEIEAKAEKGMTTAEAIFDAEVKLLEAADIKTGITTIDLSKFAENDYYIVAAGVKAGEDNGSFISYVRAGQAKQASFSTMPLEGCKWEKVEDLTSLNAGKYLLVAEKAQLALNGALSGDANTGALTSTGNTTAVELKNGAIITENKSFAFELTEIEGGYALQSASGYYIGGKDGMNGITASESAQLNTVTATSLVMSCGFTLSLANGKMMYRSDDAIESAQGEPVVLYALTQDAEKEDPIVENPTVEITFIDGQLTFTPSAEEFEYAFVARSATEHQSDLDNEFDDDDVFEIQSSLIEQSYKGTLSINANTISKAGGYYYIIAAAVTGEDMGTWTLYSRAGKATGLGIYITVVDGITTVSVNGQTIATKRLENGQIIITTEAGSYNVQGQLR